MAILATAGLVAARVNTTEASAKSHTEQRGVFDDDGISAQQSESTGKPYIGIAVTSVQEDSATDGALIVRVVEGSAADGNLEVDDIITALDGESVGGPRDVVRIVHEHSPSDVIVFSVVREGASMDISVTAGEYEASGHEGRGGKRGGHYKSGIFDKSNEQLVLSDTRIFDKSNEQLVLSDTRYMTDGVKTVRKAVGTAQNIDASAGTFDLLLRDDSETLSFTIDADTKISTDTAEGEATLSNLSADATTMVVEVTLPDGTSEVRYVAQGEFSLLVHSILGRHGFNRMPSIGRDDSDGFSPQRFFFRWRSGNDNDGGGRGERRGRGHD